MCSIISLICRAATRWALIAALLFLSASVVRAHRDMSALENKGPWSTTCPSMDYSAFFKNDVTMQRAVALAWSMSHEGTADEHEVGFIAYQERRSFNGVYKYRTVIKNAAAGGVSGSHVNIQPPTRDRVFRTVMIFHTHPGPASERGGGYNDHPSDTDKHQALTRGIPSGLAWGSGPTWNNSDYLTFGGSYKDTSSNRSRVTSATPNAKEIEIGTVTYWFLDISMSDKYWVGWYCPVSVNGSATSRLGFGPASGDRVTQRIRVGPEGLETAEASPPHPAVPGSGNRSEGSVASQLPEMAGLEQVLSMAGQSVAPEQLEKMEKAIKGAMANPALGLAMNSGWEDSERVEFVPLGDEPVVFSASLEKTWPSFMSGGQDQVTGMSSVKTTVTSLPQTETGFAFVTVQEMRANAMGRIPGKIPMTRSKASAAAAANVNGTMKFEYSRASRLELNISLSQQLRESSPDPPMLKPPPKPGVELYWEATAIVTDRDGRVVDLLRFPKLTCPVNCQVADTRSLPLPLPPEGQVYIVTLDAATQGGNYVVVGPATVQGGWSTTTVTIQGQASATLVDEAEAEPALEPDRPVS